MSHFSMDEKTIAKILDKLEEQKLVNEDNGHYCFCGISYDSADSQTSDQ